MLVRHRGDEFDSDIEGAILHGTCVMPKLIYSSIGHLRISAGIQSRSEVRVSRLVPQAVSFPLQDHIGVGFAHEQHSSHPDSTSLQSHQ